MPVDQPVDGLALWDSEAEGHTPAGLNTVRLDGSEALLVPFTLMMVRVTLHFVAFGAISGYARCNGAGCLLCRIGRQREVRDLWPVYCLANKAVEVVAISPNLRAHALRPQVSHLLRRLAGGEDPFLISARLEKNRYTVATLPVPRGADDGAITIVAFQEKIKAGQIDLASAYQTLSNEEWGMIDEVRTFMVAKGVTL